MLKPEGFFVANYKAGTTNYTGEGWLYPQCAPYTSAFFDAAVHDAGLRYLPLDWPHPGLKWVLIVHPGREQAIPRLSLQPGAGFLRSTGWLRRVWRRIAG